MISNRFKEEDFKMFVQGLIDTNRIEGKEAGIAKLMLDKGYSSLSPKQKFVFDKMIENIYVPMCDGCAAEIPWSEMLEALDNGNYCNYCQHMIEKID